MPTADGMPSGKRVPPRFSVPMRGCRSRRRMEPERTRRPPEQFVAGWRSDAMWAGICKRDALLPQGEKGRRYQRLPPPFADADLLDHAVVVAPVLTVLGPAMTVVAHVVARPVAIVVDIVAVVRTIVRVAVIGAIGAIIVIVIGRADADTEAQAVGTGRAPELPSLDEGSRIDPSLSTTLAFVGHSHSLLEAGEH